jgi:hypothetical protein
MSLMKRKKIMKTSMKSPLIIVLFLLILDSNPVYAQSKDTSFVFVIEKNFKILEDCIVKKTSYNGSMGQAISFFVLLTGIGREGWADYRDRVPAQKDIDRWKAWYYLNKNDLYWDKERREVVYRISVKPPVNTIENH